MCHIYWLKILTFKFSDILLVNQRSFYRNCVGNSFIGKTQELQKSFNKSDSFWQLSGQVTDSEMILEYERKKSSYLPRCFKLSIREIVELSSGIPRAIAKSRTLRVTSAARTYPKAISKLFHILYYLLQNLKKQVLFKRFFISK